MVALYLVRRVPGATDDAGALSKEFWLSAFFTIVGFLITTAAISPLVAQYTQWRDDRAWRAARVNAIGRLANALDAVLDSYRAFLDQVSRKDPHGLAPTLLAETAQALDDVFDWYDAEHPVFNADRHSAASDLRQHLLPLRRSLGSTLAMANRLRSWRIHLGTPALDAVRSAFDKLPLGPISPLARDPYYGRHGELFIDWRLDTQLGAGVMPIHRFAALDTATIRSHWDRFVRAIPAGGPSPPVFEPTLQADTDSQARLHAMHVRASVSEAFLADLLVRRDLSSGTP